MRAFIKYQKAGHVYILRYRIGESIKPVAAALTSWANNKQLNFRRGDAIAVAKTIISAHKQLFGHGP